MPPHVAETSAPCFIGFVENSYDALLLITASRMGGIPRLRRRLSVPERPKLIRSGSVFLWIDEEIDVQRWIDGRSWSASRVSKDFLLYREMTQRGGGRSRTARAIDMRRSSTQSESPEYIRMSQCVRALAGPLLNKGEFDELIHHGNSGMAGPRDNFKRGGLIKKTFSLELPREKWHIVAYYSLEDALTGRLENPRESSHFAEMSLEKIPEEIWRAYVREEVEESHSGMSSSLRGLQQFRLSSDQGLTSLPQPTIGMPHTASPILQIDPPMEGGHFGAYYNPSPGPMAAARSPFELVAQPYAASMRWEPIADLYSDMICCSSQPGQWPLNRSIADIYQQE